MKFKFLTWAMLLAGLTFGASSCDDDDDDEPKQEQGKDGEKEETAENAGATYLGQMYVTFADSVYKTDMVKVANSYDSLGNLNLDFYGVKFVPQMPVSLNITVPSIPCQKNNGVVTFQADSIVPTMSSKPMAQYTATGIKGEIKGDSITFSLNFANYPTSYAGVAAKDGSEN